MLKAADVDYIARDVAAVPDWFCNNWIAGRTAINMIVAQIGNPLVGMVWRVLRGILNRVHKTQCAA